MVTAPDLAEATGIEPAIFGLTGRRVRPLHYASNTRHTTIHVHGCQTGPGHPGGPDMQPGAAQSVMVVNRAYQTTSTLGDTSRDRSFHRAAAARHLPQGPL